MARCVPYSQLTNAQREHPFLNGEITKTVSGSVERVRLLILVFPCRALFQVSYLIFLTWACYPVVWLFSEGFASFSISFEVCAYAILDIASKVGLSFMLMSANDVLSASGTESQEFV